VRKRFSILSILLSLLLTTCVAAIGEEAKSVKKKKPIASLTCLKLTKLLSKSDSAGALGTLRKQLLKIKGVKRVTITMKKPSGVLVYFDPALLSREKLLQTPNLEGLLDIAPDSPQQLRKPSSLESK